MTELENPEEIFAKPEQKTLVLEFDDNENIIDLTVQALRDNNINNATVAEASGKVKQGTLSYFDKVSEQKIELKETSVHGASGRFEYLEDKGAFQGDIDLFIKHEGRMISGLLLNGNSCKGFTLKLRFLENKK